MTSARCPRSFQVEAMRDGRLVGTEQAGFLRHMAQCPACLQEAKKFDELAHCLRAGSMEEEPANELRVARDRVQLLAAFDRTLVSPKSTRERVLRPWWPVALGLVAAACVFGVWRMQQPEAPGAEVTVTQADRAAVWSRRQEGERDLITLVQGELAIHVDHHTSDRRGRVLVLLPDGELEDVGTAFTVSAAHGRTTRVAVAEGSVVLRLNGKSPVSVSAGQAWIQDWRRPETPPQVKVDGHGDSPALGKKAGTKADAGLRPALSIPQGRRTAVLAMGERPPTATPARRSAALHVADPESNPVLDFRAAMAQLDAGANREAAAAFAKFCERYPGDRRAEDAAYLRIIALQRSGDENAMKRAAGEYLRLHPTGFRHAEVEPLSR